MGQRIHLDILLDTVIMMLCIKLPQMTGYAKKLEFNFTMSFKIRR